MGIAPYVAEAIIREHKFKSITGDVLLLGRQTMLFSPQDAVAMIRGQGIEPAPIPLDGSIIDRQTLAAQGHSYIRDDAFFRLLGVDKIRALDHTDYEGAEVIHDLNVPVPDRLEGIADFILDGSTLDNVWDAATTLRNVARFLRTGGRLLSINMGSNHATPYLVFTPQWLLDYFVANHFADCKVYIVVHGNEGQISFFIPDPDRLLLPGANALGNFTSSFPMGVLVLAEKGADSTWDKIPIQQTYRPDEAMVTYEVDLARMRMKKRPHPIGSTGLTPIYGNSDGWLYVDKDGSVGPIGPRTTAGKRTITSRAMRRIRAATAALMGRPTG